MYVLLNATNKQDVTHKFSFTTLCHSTGSLIYSKIPHISVIQTQRKITQKNSDNFAVTKWNSKPRFQSYSTQRPRCSMGRKLYESLLLILEEKIAYDIFTVAYKSRVS